MRWKAFVDGEKRERSRFAWLPTWVKGEWVWLERYISKERYCSGRGDGCFWIEDTE